MKYSGSNSRLHSHVINLSGSAFSLLSVLLFKAKANPFKYLVALNEARIILL